MDKALAKKSDILKIKYKFFINRLVTYFSFLLIPVWIHSLENLTLFTQAIILLTYMLFMGGQWYLFGKEIDHRFKIYYKANSSMERIVYRIITGNIGLLLLFNIIALFPTELVGYCFWGFFALIGVFYSWPTRGKIIEETMLSQFGEIRYLDSFEKTILLLSVFTFFVTVPDFPMFENIEALKLYLDPNERVNGMLWGYLSVLYYPFQGFPKLYNLIWSFHFYFICLGIFIFSFYCFLRYFFSRRLSMLGVYAVLSSWMMARLLGSDFFGAINTTFSLVWLWSLMWSTRSGTYRAGLFTGLVGFYLTIFNPVYFLLIPIGTFVTYAFLMPSKTPWFKRQWVKYNGLGFAIATVVLILGSDNASFIDFNFSLIFSSALDFIYRKAFFVIAPLGIVLVLLYMTNGSKYLLTYINLDKEKLREALIGIFVLTFLGVLVNPVFATGFSLLWILAFFSIIPIEWIFQSISRLRSKRNLIYAMYILVCLLDSQLENRIRIVAKMFLDTDSLRFLIQY